MMRLPFLIRGTPEWDNREYMRYLLGNKVMSFGPISPEMADDPWRYKYVKDRIRLHLSNRGVSKAEIERFARRPKQ